MISSHMSKAGHGFFNAIKGRFMSTTSQLRKRQDYDVVIAGGGMVGGAMACALGKSPYMSDKKILLLEASSQMSTDILHNPPVHHSNRVVAISPGNVEFLCSLGVWERIPRSKPVLKMQVWDACSDSVLNFDNNNMTEELCTITENNMIAAGLYEVLDEAREVVDVRYGAKISSCDTPLESDAVNTPVKVALEDGSSVDTKLLIGADGANSVVAKCLNIKKLAWDYNQCGVVATLQLSEPTDNIVAWQRFLPTGPIAMLPLNDDCSSLVWTTTPQHARELVAMETDEFVAAINKAYWEEHPRDELAQKTKNFIQSFLPGGNMMQYPPTVSDVLVKQQLFPLGFSHAKDYVKTGVALIGDAAHRIHPQAGQGVNMGFRDVSCLTDVLNEAVYKGEYIGSLSHLLEYESKCQYSNFPIALSVDGLKWLFANDNAALSALRSIGMAAIEATPPVKKFFVDWVGK